MNKINTRAFMGPKWFWITQIFLVEYQCRLRQVQFILVRSKSLLGDVNKLFVFKSLLTMPSNVLPLHFKKTFPPIIWIFTEGESDGMESRLPFKIFSTLLTKLLNFSGKEIGPWKNTIEITWIYWILSSYATIWNIQVQILFKNMKQFSMHNGHLQR